VPLEKPWSENNASNYFLISTNNVIGNFNLPLFYRQDKTTRLPRHHHHFGANLRLFCQEIYRLRGEKEPLRA